MAEGKTKTSVKKDGISSNWVNFVKSQNQSPKFKVPASENPRKPQPKKESKVVSIDCEMVSDLKGDSMLARVSVVDYNLVCIYDKFVKPTAPIGDYRTRVSGIRPGDMENGEDFAKVQKEVRHLLYNKILVGHGLFHDMKVLQFRHHFKLIRDTSAYPPFREIGQGKTPALRKLVEHFLKETIQEGEHNSVQDATAAMKLYKKFHQEWETYKIKSMKRNK